MPTGSYNYEDEGASIDDVLERAKKAAAATGHDAKVLVTKGARKWVGLGEAEE